jgi:DNA polymerase III subunit epsilon
MGYAIVDIETTGGYAAASSITEISIRVHDGKGIVAQFESLVNPGVPIPAFIRSLTGITDKMVAKAPPFSKIAQQVYDMLQGHVFVAHSVNFDYSFVKHELEACGYPLNLKKLCTVRLSRKIFPGLPSYSLGKLCNNLGIATPNRHRAGGDTAATVKLFDMLLANDTTGIISQFLKRTSKDQVLPPHVPREQFEHLPGKPGVYYFHNQKGKIVYVGKAKNIKKRVSSHFSNNSASKQKQDFMRNLHGITYEECGSELMALILESHQIKHLWPEYNRSQKRFEPVYGIVEYTDQRGFKRLGIEKMRKHSKPLASFSIMLNAFDCLNNLVNEFGLCNRLAGLATDTGACEEKGCACLSTGKRNIKKYNDKVEEAIATLARTESFVIVEKGRQKDEAGLIVVENGTFKHMGYLPGKQVKPTQLKPEIIAQLPVYRENFNIRQIISGYRLKQPDNVIMLNNSVAG